MEHTDNFFVLHQSSKGGWGIPMKHAHLIRRNFRDGKPWWLCSPVYSLSRADIARIVTADLKGL